MTSAYRPAPTSPAVAGPATAPAASPTAEDLLPPVARFLRQARKARGLSVAQLAASIGMRTGELRHPNTITQWERGSMPKANDWMAACYVLGVNPWDCSEMYTCTRAQPFANPHAPPVLPPSATAPTPGEYEAYYRGAAT